VAYSGRAARGDPETCATLLRVPPSSRKPAWELALLAVVPVLLHWRSLDVGLFLDDFAILGRLHAWRAEAPGATWWDVYVLGTYDERLRFSGLLPWWTAEAVRLHFFRPLAAATHALDGILWPQRPWAMHLHNALWLSAATLAVRSLYALLLDRRTATIAATVFAVSYVHAWPVGWIANRNALVAVTFGVLTLRAYARARGQARTPWHAALWLLASLLAAEAGVAVVGYVLAYELTFGRSRKQGRAVAIVLVGAVVIGWRIAYSQMGFGAIGSGTYIDPLQAPLAFASLAPERLASLLRFLLSPAEGLPISSAPVMAAVEVALLLLALPVLRHGLRAPNRFWLFGLVLCLVPLLASVAQSRLLGPAVVGLAPLVAGALVDAWTSHGRLGRALAVALALPHLVLSPLIASRTVAQAILGDGPKLGSPGLALGELRATNLVVLDAPTLVTAQEIGAARARAGPLCQEV